MYKYQHRIKIDTVRHILLEFAYGITVFVARNAEYEVIAMRKGLCSWSVDCGVLTSH